jgi:uracil phosphoribosyltransferase
MPLRVVAYPVAKHLLAEIRDKETPQSLFRQLTRSLTTLLVLEATRNAKVLRGTVQTPLGTAVAERLGEQLAVVPVLRAGLGMLESVVEIFPDVAVGYIGLERNEDTAVARRYYSKIPDLAGKLCLCLDPMLATGGSATQAIGFMKMRGATKVTMVCVVAAPEGVAHLQANHPDVEIVTAALDDHLDPRRYIYPGLGDFGDRLYATA